MAGCTARSAPVSSAGQPDGLLEAQRAWWTALATSDTSYLRAHSDPVLTVTLSSGKTFSIASLIRTFPTNRHNVTIEWAEEAVQYRGAGEAVTVAQSTESDGRRPSVYRFLTVFRATNDGWKVIAAQSTRRNAFTPRSYVHGRMTDFEGDYSTPRGLTLKLTANDSSITLREPSGLEVRMEPIGLNLFEATSVSPDGSITRYSFGRDQAGRVVSLSVLVPGVVNTFPKVQ